MLFVSISFHIVVLSFDLFHTVDQDTDLHIEQELERVFVQRITILRKAMQDIVRDGGISVSRYETGCQFVWNEGTRLEDERVVLAHRVDLVYPKVIDENTVEVDACRPARQMRSHVRRQPVFGSFGTQVDDVIDVIAVGVQLCNRHVSANNNRARTVGDGQVDIFCVPPKSVIATCDAVFTFFSLPSSSEVHNSWPSLGISDTYCFSCRVSQSRVIASP